GASCWCGGLEMVRREVSSAAPAGRRAPPAPGAYHPPRGSVHASYAPQVKGDALQIRKAVALLAAAKRPIIYTGGGVINSGRKASKLLRELVQVTGFPITSTLLGLGAYPASGPSWLGMLGMHCTHQANIALLDRDLLPWIR